MQRIRFCFAPLMVVLLLFCFARNGNADTPTVALLSPDNSRFWELVVGFSKAVARDLDLDLIVYTDAEKNRFSYRTLLSRVLEGDDRPDYVMFMAKEMVTKDMLEMAGKAGVKVFTFNTDVPADESDAVGQPRQRIRHWIGHISPDNRSAGKSLADVLLQAARKNNRDLNKERWGVIGLSGTRDSSAAKDRDRGLEDARADSAMRLLQLVYADWSEQEAYDKTRRLLTRYPNTDIVWSASDGMALGAIAALEAKGLKPGMDVLVGGVDWEPRALEAIREGKLFTSFGRHYMGGGLALLLIHDYHAGYDFDAGGGNVLSYEFEMASWENLGQIERSLSPDAWDSVDFRQFSQVYNPDIQALGLTANELMNRFMDSLSTENRL